MFCPISRLASCKSCVELSAQGTKCYSTRVFNWCSFIVEMLMSTFHCPIPSKLFILSCFRDLLNLQAILYWWGCHGLNESIAILMLTPFCSYRKRASPLPKDDHSSGVKDCLLANSSDPVEMRRLNYQTPGNTSYTICTVDTHYQTARAPCVLLHMHVYTFHMTQCVIFKPITICTMHKFNLSFLYIHNTSTSSIALYHLYLVQ